MKTRISLFALSLAALTLTIAPRLASADGSRVALGGFCPVAYIEMGQAVYGDAKFSVNHDGRTYHVVDEKAQKMFEASPAKYAGAVRYDAWCATALAMGKKSATDPEQFVVRNGVIYLFTNAEAKAMFEKDPAGTIKKADATWKKLGA